MRLPTTDDQVIHPVVIRNSEIKKWRSRRTKQCEILKFQGRSQIATVFRGPTLSSSNVEGLNLRNVSEQLALYVNIKSRMQQLCKLLKDKYDETPVDLTLLRGNVFRGPKVSGPSPTDVWRTVPKFCEHENVATPIKRVSECN